MKPLAVVFVLAAPLFAHRIDSLSPSARTAGSDGFQLTLRGEFIPGGEIIRFNGVTVERISNTSTTVVVQIPSNLIPSSLGSPQTVAVSAFSSSLPNLVQAPFTFNPAPKILPDVAALPEATATAPYGVAFSVTGGTPPFTWSCGTPLPPGLSWVAASGSCRLQGTPTAASAGTYAIQVSASDGGGGGVVSRSYQLTIRPPLSITTTSLPAGRVGQAYAAQLTPTGGVTPYSWARTAGQLPPGLTLSATGQITGTPTTAGAYPFAVRVTDVNAAVSSANLAVNVSPPVLTIATTSLPSGTVGVAYSATVQASGGTPPYSWSATGLPPGVSISANGVLSGTPLSANTYNPLVTVTDAQSQSANRAVQFSNALRRLPFTIPASQSTASFAINFAGVNTGTTAGEIRITATLSSSGIDVTPRPSPQLVIRVAPAAPVIDQVEVTRSASGITVRTRAYSSSRSLTGARFRFTAASGAALQTSEITLAPAELFDAWFRSPESSAFGSAFLFTQPFSVQGDAGLIRSVEVVLTNRFGNAEAVRRDF